MVNDRWRDDWLPDSLKAASVDVHVLWKRGSKSHVRHLRARWGHPELRLLNKMLKSPKVLTCSPRFMEWTGCSKGVRVAMNLYLLVWELFCPGAPMFHQRLFYENRVEARLPETERHRQDYYRLWQAVFCFDGTLACEERNPFSSKVLKEVGWCGI